MTKSDLIERLAAKAELSRPRAEELVDFLLDNVTEALKQGEKVNISGFGTFTVSIRRRAPAATPRPVSRSTSRRLARRSSRPARRSRKRSTVRPGRGVLDPVVLDASPTFLTIC